MGDKKKFLYDLLTSEVIGDYFQELFEKQTNSIISHMNETEMKQQNEELETLQRKYQETLVEKEKIKKRCGELEINLNKMKEKNKFLCNHNSNLETKLESKHQEIQELMKEKEKLIAQIQEVSLHKDREIQKIKERLGQEETELKSYEEKYRDMDIAYCRYNELSLDAKNRLRNIFESDSIYGIVAACYDWRNIEGIWAFVKRRIVEKEMSDVENLVFLFEFLFHAYNLKGTEQKYELIKPELGEKFDSDKHTIIGIQTDGIVSKVRLPGIRGMKSRKILQRALIEV